MSEFKYTQAYKSIKTPIDLKTKILRNNTAKKTINLKLLISLVACVIIMAVVPTYVVSTNPSVSVTASLPTSARSIMIQIPLELKLNRTSTIYVSHGNLENYNGESIRGNLYFTWSFTADLKEKPTLAVKDVFKTTVYSLSYNENNGSWSIIK
ncbi:MAG: hypothetical protein IJA55_01710 [Clostridia bacterium]|nr:hypothetical protein [Clostridia bacterium]